MDAKPYLAIDFGGTKIFAAVGHADGTLLASSETHSDHDVDRCLDAMLAACDQALASCSLTRSDIARLGIGSPSVIDRDKGIVSPHNLDWPQVPLRDLLQQRFGTGVDVLLENDCSAGGLGEYHFGAGKDHTRLVYFGIGTGVGGVVLVDGKIVAEELGMFPVTLGGPAAGGVTGAVEAYAGGKALAERFVQACASPEEALERVGKKEGETLNAGDIHAAAAHDPLADQTWKHGELALGAAVGAMTTIFAPDLTVIGGGVADRAGERYIAAVTAAAEQFVLIDRRAYLDVRPAQLGQKSVAYGALALAAGL